MDIKKYKFQEISMMQKTDRKLLEEAKKRGFYNGDTKYNDLFGDIFYRGVPVNFKDGLDEELKENATAYLKSFMMSFEPKHEEKEAVSALILSEIIDC